MNIKNFFREPLVQFFILGVLLFFVVSYVKKKTDTEDNEIFIGDSQLSQMIVKYRAQSGTIPTKIQLEAIIDDHIKTEVLYREAMRMGLHKNDEIVRRRLAQKLEFLKNNLTKLEDPSITELQLFYENNLSFFQKQATVSFSHVYFTTDNVSDKASKQRASSTLDILKKDSEQSSSDFGDRFPLQYEYTEQSMIDVQQNFGNYTMVDSLFNSEKNIWIGPVRSGYGWHLIFISNRNDKERIPFEIAMEDVKANYLEAERLEINKKVYDEMKDKYVIRLNYLNNK